MAPAPSASISTTASPNPSSGGQRRGPLAADSAPRTGPKGAPSITTPPWLLRTAQSSATGWWASPKGIRRFRSALWDCMVLLVSLSLWFWFYSYWIRVFSGLQRIWDWNWSSLLVCLGGNSACITQLLRWGCRARRIWWHSTPGAICFGCLVIASVAPLLHLPVMDL